MSEDQLRAAGERLRRAQRDRDAAMAKLAAVIVRAAGEGMPRSHIAEAAGVSRQTVYDVLAREQ